MLEGSEGVRRKEEWQNGSSHSPSFPRSLVTGQVAQQGKVLAAKPDDLNSIPRTHILERENQLL